MDLRREALRDVPFNCSSFRAGDWGLLAWCGSVCEEL